MRICVCLLLMLLCACHRAPDEQRLRDAVRAMQQAMQAREPRAFMQHVASDFTAQQGEFDRQALHNLLRAQVLRNAAVGVSLGPLDVHVDGDRASVSLVATLTGGSGNVFPDRAGVYAITSAWRREGADWQCYNARWERKM